MSPQMASSSRTEAGTTRSLSATQRRSPSTQPNSDSRTPSRCIDLVVLDRRLRPAKPARALLRSARDRATEHSEHV